MAEANTQSLRLPDFIGVGPPRTATTWLHEALHGHVGLPAHVKETNFFVWRYGNGIDWYAEHFRECPVDLPAGEFSPMYFVEEETRERIARLIPGCKIICTFRDPVQRTYSHYRKMRQGGWYSGSFEECVEKRLDVLEWSRYATYLKAWQRFFGRENVLVVLQDDLEANSQRFLDDVCDFLRVNRVSLAGSKLPSEKVNAIPTAPWNPVVARAARFTKEWLRQYGLYAPVDLAKRLGLSKFLFSGGHQFEKLRPETAARLREFFRPEVDALEEMLQRDLSAWKGRAATDPAPRETVQRVP